MTNNNITQGGRPGSSSNARLAEIIDNLLGISEAILAETQNSLPFSNITSATHPSQGSLLVNPMTRPTDTAYLNQVRGRDTAAGIVNDNVNDNFYTVMTRQHPSTGAGLSTRHVNLTQGARQPLQNRTLQNRMFDFLLFINRLDPSLSMTLEELNSHNYQTLLAFIVEKLPPADAAITQQLAADNTYCPITHQALNEMALPVYVAAGNAVYSFENLLRAWFNNAKNPVTGAVLSLNELQKLNLPPTTGHAVDHSV